MARARLLTAEDFADESRLTEAIHAVLLGQRGLRVRSWKIRRLQGELRKLIDDRTWKTYLSLEETVNDRAIRELVVVARWAFAEGVRAGRAVKRRRRGPGA